MKPPMKPLVEPKGSRAMVHNMQSMMVIFETMATEAEKKQDANLLKQCDYAYMTLMKLIQAFMSAALAASTDSSNEDLQIDAAMVLAPEVGDA